MTTFIATETDTINGHKVTIGVEKMEDAEWITFPWIQIDDGPIFVVDTDGDHHGSIGIDNPEDYKGTILEKYIDNKDMYGDESDTYFFDMGGIFTITGEDGYGHYQGYEDIIDALGMKDNGDGAYGNG